MKQIPLLQGNAMIVELPEGAPKLYVINTGQPHLSYLDIDVDLPEINLPPGNWRIIGMLGEVTESDASGLVEEQPQENDNSLPEHKRRWWKNYTGGVPFPESRALESLESSILAEGWKFHNPYKKPDYIPKTMTAEFAYREEMDDWEKAQSRVLCRERCLLLGREDL